jgi:hypothetical protein
VLAASKTSAKSTKKTSILLIGGLFTAILISISWYFFFAKLPLDQRDIYVQIPVLVTQFSCLVASLFTVLRLGLKSSEGRYYLSLVIATGLWSAAQSIWAYSQIILQIEMPYPSIADFLWLLGYAFLSYHFYYSFKVWNKANVVKRYSIIGAIIITSILIGNLIYLSLQSSADEEFDIVTTIVSNLYIVGNGLLLAPAIVIMWSLSGRDILLLHRVLLCYFIILNMLGDVGFVYNELLVEEDAFAQQEWVWWMVYTISYLLFIGGLIWYNKISTTINKNIQSTIDKQYPYLEKLWNETSNNNHKSNISESEKGFEVEHFTNPELINHKIENTLRKTHDDILFLISTEEIFLKIKTQIYKFIKIFAELNVDVRILIPGSDGLRDLAFELEKHSKVRFQRLYRPLSKDSAIFVIDSNAILDLELKKDEDISNGDGKELLLYSEREAQVQSHIALFENCWMLPWVHENISNR